MMEPILNNHFLMPILLIIVLASIPIFLALIALLAHTLLNSMIYLGERTIDIFIPDFEHTKEYKNGYKEAAKAYNKGKEEFCRDYVYKVNHGKSIYTESAFRYCSGYIGGCDSMEAEELENKLGVK